MKEIIKLSNWLVADKIYVPKKLRKYVQTKKSLISGGTVLDKGKLK